MPVPTASLRARSLPVGRRSFRRGQWSILLLIMFTYLFFYTGRQNLGFAARGMQEDLGLSATAIGAFSAVMLLSYGLGQAVNGNLADLYGARRLVAFGAYASVFLNWAVSWTTSFGAALLLWGANGFAQSTAWPAMNRTLANWWPRRERGKAVGFYLLAAGASSTLTFVLCILVLDSFDWRWIFRLPVTLMLIGGTAFLMLARNRPEDAGYPPLPSEPGEPTPPGGPESSSSRYRSVLSNRSFLLACLSIGCESIARYGLLSWVPVHFLGAHWRENTAALWVTLALPFGMALGALASGLIADHWFAERRSLVAIYGLGLASLSCLLLAFTPPSWTAAGVVLLAVSGFLVYGPQATYWALCPGLVGRERAGTAVGLMDAAAYGFAALGQLGIGRAIDVSQSSGSAFFVIAAACLAGALVMLPVRE